MDSRDRYIYNANSIKKISASGRVIVNLCLYALKEPFNDLYFCTDK